MYLPKVIAFNAKDETAKKRYGVIADYMHLGGSSDDEKVELLIAYLRKMNDDLNIPLAISVAWDIAKWCRWFTSQNRFCTRRCFLKKS